MTDVVHLLMVTYTNSIMISTKGSHQINVKAKYYLNVMSVIKHLDLEAKKFLYLPQDHQSICCH